MDSAEYLRLGPSRDNRAGHEDEDGSTVEFPAALSLSVSFSKHLVTCAIAYKCTFKRSPWLPHPYASRPINITGFALIPRVPLGQDWEVRTTYTQTRR